MLDYGQAVEQFYEPLYRFAFSLAGNEDDAADLTQETCRVLLLKGDQIRDARKLKSWLFTTLYRNFLGQRRHQTKFPDVPLETVEGEVPALSARAAESAEAKVVLAALQALKEQYRAPLMLFYLEELSYREIAQTLGVSIGTIMSRLSRGKAMLRKRLEGDLIDDAAAGGESASRTGARRIPVAWNAVEWNLSLSASAT